MPFWLVIVAVWLVAGFGIGHLIGKFLERRDRWNR